MIKTDFFSPFGHKNADIASNVKYFISDGLNLLNEKEDKVYLLKVEPKY